MKRRLSLVVGSIATIVALLMTGAGVSLALLSASRASSSNTFTAGSVTGNGSVLQSCSASNITPSTSTTVAELASSGSTSISTGSNTVAVTPLTQAISTGQTLLIGQGTTTVTATVSSPFALNATSITFTTTGSGSFAQGTLVTDLSSQNSSAPKPCRFQFTYGGSVNEYLAADILVVSGDASHPKLWDPSAAGLELVMTDGSNNVYTLPTAASTCPSSGEFASSVPSGTLTCGLSFNDVLSTTTVSSGTFTLTLDWGLPIPAPTADQNGNTTIFVLFHAVQSGNNSLKCSTTPTAPGQPCAASSPFSWS